MKKDFKNFALGFIIACLLITPAAVFADTIQVSLNTVNIDLNGERVAEKGQTYTLDNGTVVPYSLNYNGTVYLPIRKVSELIGKDISYNGSSSTVSIKDKNSEPETPVTDPETPTDDTATDEDTAVEEETANSGGSNKEETGFAVVNSFPKVLNGGGEQVNRLVGYMDGTTCDMLTSEKDLIGFSMASPSLYEVTYKNNVITEMRLVSPEKSDTVKTNSNSGTVAGNQGTYTLASDVVCYKIEKKDDGSIDRYSVTNSSFKAGDKVYLYDVGGKSGYDIILIEKK